MKQKNRLDLLLCKKESSLSREKAKALIMAGVVFVDDQKADKPGSIFSNDAKIEIRDNPNPFVSRGGLKLLKALKEFKISVKGKVVLDIGASTGGFSDCMLQNGAQKVYSVDVGYGQLAYILQQDPRVISLERTHIKNLTAEQVVEDIDFFTVDVSFISLCSVLPHVTKFLSHTAAGVVLIKPQFEAEKNQVGKNGVVKDLEVHKEVVKKVIKKAKEIGFFVKNLTFSPIKGPKGNIEYLLYIAKKLPGLEQSESLMDLNVDDVVEEAYENLKK